MAHRNRIKRRDNNQADIEKGLAQVGYTFVDLSQVGGGVCDLLVGAHGFNYLFEIKNPDSSHGITESQSQFYDEWKGQKAVVDNIYQLLHFISRHIKSL